MHRLPALYALGALTLVPLIPGLGSLVAQHADRDRFAVATAPTAPPGPSFPTALRPTLRRAPSPVLPSARASGARDAAHPIAIGFGSAVGAGAGALVGTLAGGSLYLASGVEGSGEDPGFEALLTGYLVGAGTGSALGAHLFNRGRGELRRSLLTTALVGATGALLCMTGEDGGTTSVLMLATPVATTLLATSIEWASSPSTAAAPDR